MKQDSLDTYNERDPFKNDDARDEEEDAEDADSGIEGEVDPLDRDVIIQPPPPPPPLRPPTERISFPKGLPWAPKVRLMACFCFRRLIAPHPPLAYLLKARLARPRLNHSQLPGVFVQGKRHRALPGEQQEQVHRLHFGEVGVPRRPRPVSVPRFMMSLIS